MMNFYAINKIMIYFNSLDEADATDVKKIILFTRSTANDNGKALSEHLKSFEIVFE